MAIEKVDYASILFNGECNLNCPSCIGKFPDFQNQENNLNARHLNGLEDFLTLIKSLDIHYLSISGIHADPQLYSYEHELLAHLRNHYPNLILSIHTNGLLATKKIDKFNMYHKATISFPSFEPETYRKVTGSKEMPDLKGIMEISKIPLKLSFLLADANKDEFPDYIQKVRNLGIKRVIVRKLFGRESAISFMENITPAYLIHNCPVYHLDGVEVTVWNHSETTVKGLYLFPDGSIRRRII